MHGCGSSANDKIHIYQIHLFCWPFQTYTVKVRHKQPSVSFMYSTGILKRSLFSSHDILVLISRMGKVATAMEAHSTQALGVAIFLLAFTCLPVGLVGGGVIFYLLGLVLLGVSLAIFVKCKPLENAEN